MRRRAIRTSVASTAAAFALVPAANAAQPANQACLGADFSSYAREGSPTGGALNFTAGSGFGLTSASLAQTFNGLAGPIQSHLAGNTSDNVVPNTCNDD